MRWDPGEAGGTIRPQCMADSSERDPEGKASPVEASETAVQGHGKFRKATGTKLFVGGLQGTGLPWCSRGTHQGAAQGKAPSARMQQKTSEHSSWGHC